MRLFVVEPLGSGGMIHYAYQLCTALADQGAEVTLVTAEAYEMESFPHNFAVEKRMRLWRLFDPRSMEQPPRSRWVSAWRKVHWTARRGVRALRLVREWLRLTGYLLRQKPDIIQFGKINFPFEALFLARLRRKGLVLTDICHEFELREKSGPLAAWGSRLYAGAFENFAAIFFHAESNRERFLALFDVPPERLHIIPHGNENLFPASGDEAEQGLNLRQRYGLAPEEPVVLFFGTLNPSKGLPDLLQAFALVRGESEARLLIAGYPSKFIDMDELYGLVEALGLADAVIFDTRYIPIEEVAPLMGLARVVVYPYRNSTQSGALQVAYAFGRPVIATDVGGLPEAVDDGRSGLLVPPQAPAELSRAILKLVHNPELAAEMGEYARHLSETRYSWRPIAEKILSVYRGL